MPSPITNATGPQSGAVTHHQDQSIFPHNFKARNTKNNAPPKSIEYVFLLSLITLPKLNIAVGHILSTTRHSLI